MAEKNGKGIGRLPGAGFKKKNRLDHGLQYPVFGYGQAARCLIDFVTLANNAFMLVFQLDLFLQIGFSAFS
jgi:hypothetical protein